MASTGFGITIDFATSAFSAEIIDTTPPEQTRESIQTSHTETANDAHTFIPADLSDPGELSFDINFDPDESPPINGATESITITFASGTTWAFSGFMTGYTPAAPMDDRMTASVTVKVSGPITITPAV